MCKVSKYANPVAFSRIIFLRVGDNLNRKLHFFLLVRPSTFPGLEPCVCSRLILSGVINTMVKRVGAVGAIDLTRSSILSKMDIEANSLKHFFAL